MREDDLVALLREAQCLLLKYPAAAQAAFKAFVAEGRTFAATPAGRWWVERLAGSDLVRRGRELWESSALNMLEESAPGVLPSSLMDAMVRAIMQSDLARVLQRLVPEEE